MLSWSTMTFSGLGNASQWRERRPSLQVGDIQTALVMGWIIHSSGYSLSWSGANSAQLGGSCVCAWRGWGERQVQTGGLQASAFRPATGWDLRGGTCTWLGLPHCMEPGFQVRRSKRQSQATQYSKKNVFGLLPAFLAQSSKPLEFPEGQGCLWLFLTSPFGPHLSLC